MTSRINAYGALATLLIAGCAATPDQAQPPAPAREQSATVAAVVPDAVLDVQQVNASTAPPYVCREMLKPNSNVIVRRCMTEQDWKVYTRAEARRAEEQVRTLTGQGFGR